MPPISRDRAQDQAPLKSNYDPPKAKVHQPIKPTGPVSQSARKEQPPPQSARQVPISASEWMKKQAASPKPEITERPVSAVQKKASPDPTDKAKRDLAKKKERDEAMKKWRDKWQDKE